MIGDVAGHGIHAASTMGQLRMALRTYAIESLDPGEALGRLNTLLRGLQPSEMATVLYLRFDPRTGSARYASAGHPPPVRIREGKPMLLEQSAAPPLGVMRHINYTDMQITVDDGDALVLYTDGLVEQRDAAIETRFDTLIKTIASGPPDIEALCDHLTAQMLGPQIFDDVALLAFRRRALGPHLELQRARAPGGRGRRSCDLAPLARAERCRQRHVV